MSTNLPIKFPLKVFREYNFAPPRSPLLPGPLAGRCFGLLYMIDNEEKM